MKHQSPHSTHGFTLIELMIAMILGLVIIGGTVSIFIANQQAFRVQDALEETLDSGRMAFEIIARDVRAAGNSACPNSGTVTNVLNAGNNANWFNAPRGLSVLGYDGYSGSVTNQGLPINTTIIRKPNTDALLILRSFGGDFSVQGHNATSATITLNKNGPTIGQVVMMCDAAQTSIFQITNANPSGTDFNVVHNTGNGNDIPGNCSNFVGNPSLCSGAPGGGSGTPNCVTPGTPCAYEFGPDATVAFFESLLYFIGSPTGAAPWSLYRASADGTGVPVVTPLIDGIEDLQLAYGVDTLPAAQGDDQIDAYRATAALVGAPNTDAGAAAWKRLLSVQINLLAASERDRVSTDKQVYTPNLNSAASVTATDNRLYKPFSGTAFIRSPL